MPKGTTELQGWTFLTKRFRSAGGQDRANFGRGPGIVAAADPDGWEDTGAPSKTGKFDSTLVSPAVPVPAATAKL
ncbi:hypothetical protein [Streptomyces sp. NPDC059460]|uniref:hypothetical protein n=1 Tax=Streptomyces sp. NPDC059460 TaxID=3346840 RepID=UPI0036BF95AF